MEPVLIEDLSSIEPRELATVLDRHEPLVLADVR